LKLELPYIKDRPMVMVKLGLPGKRARFFEMLIDSGADHTLISKSDAAVLGLDYEKIRSNETTHTSANLSPIHGKMAKMLITLIVSKDKEIEFEIPVFVTREEVECLIGRKGVFDRFEITFKEKEQKVILKN